MSFVCAASKVFIATVWREDKIHYVQYAAFTDPRLTGVLLLD